MFGQHFSFWIPWFRHLILIHCGLENSLTRISNIQHNILWMRSCLIYIQQEMTMQQFTVNIFYSTHKIQSLSHYLTTRWQRHCRFSSAGNIDVCLSLHAHTSSWGFLWRTSLCFLWLYCSPYYKFYPLPNCVWNLSLSLSLYASSGQH